MSSKLLIVVNDPAFFISHRLPIADTARERGYKVHVATQAGESVKEIIGRGFDHHELRLSRSGKNPFSEVISILSLLALCWRIRPDVLHLVTIKPVLYGGIVARISPVRGVLAAISGLGSVFTATGLKASLLRAIIIGFYQLALGKRNLRAVFQNPEDMRLISSIGAIKPEKSILIRGSGVDLSAYPTLPEEPGMPVVIFAARLLKNKGVVEYISAVKVLKERGVQAHFQLVGDVDPGNPTSITSQELENWCTQGVVDYLGFQRDMATVMKRSHLVVLPSYREGLPKVLVEAAACGRAVITTDVPGCRDAIEPGISGMLVPVRDVSALADAMETLINDSELRRRMGQQGRKLAERAFAIEGIVDQHLTIYRTLEDNA